MAALLTAGAALSLDMMYDEAGSRAAIAKIDGVDTDFCRGSRACRRRTSSSRFRRILLKSLCTKLMLKIDDELSNLICNEITCKSASLRECVETFPVEVPPLLVLWRLVRAVRPTLDFRLLGVITAKGKLLQLPLSKNVSSTSDSKLLRLTLKVQI